MSDTYADADERGSRWAEFFAGLPHGDELEKVRVTIVGPEELVAACDAEALGCYRDNEITMTDMPVGGIASEEVARHEYGHHVAANRVNPPWLALDWGPKRWATAAGVCDVPPATAHPGDEGPHYAENPGEAWAEVYRVLADRAAGLRNGTWPIVIGRYYPDGIALRAAERDILEPWGASDTRIHAAGSTRGRRVSGCGLSRRRWTG